MFHVAIKWNNCDISSGLLQVTYFTSLLSDFICMIQRIFKHRGLRNGLYKSRTQQSFIRAISFRDLLSTWSLSAWTCPVSASALYVLTAPPLSTKGPEPLRCSELAIITRVQKEDHRHVFFSTACSIGLATTGTVFLCSSSHRRPLDFDLLSPPSIGPEASD